MNAVALYVTLGILLGLTVMQIALIAGLPIGEYAWGGKNRVLPPRLRFGAGVAVVLYAAFAAVLMSRSGVLVGGDSAPIVIGTWVLFGYAVFSVLPNLASKSPKERAVQIPVSIALAIGIGFVASMGVVI